MNKFKWIAALTYGVFVLAACGTTSMDRSGQAEVPDSTARGTMNPDNTGSSATAEPTTPPGAAPNRDIGG